LYPDRRSSQTNPYRFGRLLVAEFEQSLRGLETGAPIEYRGVRIGTVERVINQFSFDELSGNGQAIPVVLRAEPGRFGLGDNEDGLNLLDELFQRSVANGLRATVQTGNLLTGSLYISLDYYPDEAPQGMGEYDGYPTVPTIGTGLQRLERQVATLLDKINALPLGDTVDELNATIAQAHTLLASVDKIVNDEATKALPSRLEATLVELEHAAASFAEGSELYGGANETLAELSQTLASVRALAQKLEDQPNTLIFSTPQSPDPEPGEGSQ
jgi:paraquat-inducible protein B